MKLIIQNDSDALYHSAKYLSNSGMSKLLQCPALYRAWLNGELEEDSPALRLGTLFHSMVLEPHTLDAKYHVLKNSGTSKAGKEERLTAEANGKRVVTLSEWQTATDMAAAVMSHPYAGMLFGMPGQAETSIYWTEEVGDILVDCKARIDWLVNVPGLGYVAVDLKSAASADPAKLPYKISDLGYHRQAAWYRHALHLAGIDIAAFVFVFCEKAEPYIVTPATIADRAMAEGEAEYTKALDIFAECSVTGSWPCYATSVITLDLPESHYRRLEKTA